MQKLTILLDYQKNFLVSIPDLENPISMDVIRLKQLFEINGFKVDILEFQYLDLLLNYKDQFFIYQSSEILGQGYKRYIEDVIYNLERQGAIVIPKYEYLKAHHNKVYMEMMRFKFLDESLKSIRSSCFGSYHEAMKNHPIKFPVVVKEASGSSSKGVFLAKNINDYNKYIKKASSSILVKNIGEYILLKLKNKVKKTIRFFSPEKRKFLSYISQNNSQSFIVQTFVPNLKGDYKILIFGNKFFTLYRKNRKNDFRASGSGNFYEVKEDMHKRLLDFSKKITLEIDHPILGVDLGFDGERFHLIEFQMTHLGPYTLQSSNYWHECINGEWIRKDGKSNLENEYSTAIYNFLRSKEYF